jgi:hypothetical protein
MRAAQFLAIIGRGSKGSNALENTEDRAGATSEQQDNVINTVNSLDPYGPSWQLVPGNVAAGTVYAQVPTTGTGDLTFQRASTATRTNSAGNIVDVASGVGRIHYRNADGSLSSTGRLLLEPQRTNSIRNSTMVGAVAGSPGTLPTNWAQIGSGLSRTIIGTGIENGLQYIELRYNGTATANVGVYYDAVTQIAALTGQAWAHSIYVKVISGTYDSASLAMLERTSAGGAVKATSQTIVPTANLERFTYARTLDGGATVAAVQPYISFGLTIGAAYDFTIRIAAPQMELGGYATTFIPTTTAAVTRLADYARQTGVSSLIGQAEGTVFVDAYFSVTGAGRFLSINDGTSFNRILLVRNSTNTVSLVVQSTTLQALITSGILPNGLHRFAASYANNAFSLYIDGTLIGTATSGTVPACSVIDVGNENNANFFGDSIAQAALFPTRLTNAQLAEITTL